MVCKWKCKQSCAKFRHPFFFSSFFDVEMLPYAGKGVAKMWSLDPFARLFYHERLAKLSETESEISLAR